DSCSCFERERFCSTILVRISNSSGRRYKMTATAAAATEYMKLSHEISTVSASLWTKLMKLSVEPSTVVSQLPMNGPVKQARMASSEDSSAYKAMIWPRPAPRLHSTASSDF